MVMLGERALYDVIQQYLAYYHHERHHQGLDTKQPPAQAGGLVLWTERPDTGLRPVVSPLYESCPRGSARSDVPGTL
jgi:hypothetical protein